MSRRAQEPIDYDPPPSGDLWAKLDELDQADWWRDTEEEDRAFRKYVEEDIARRWNGNPQDSSPLAAGNVSVLEAPAGQTVPSSSPNEPNDTTAAFPTPTYANQLASAPSPSDYVSPLPEVTPLRARGLAYTQAPTPTVSTPSLRPRLPAPPTVTTTPTVPTAGPSNKTFATPPSVATPSQTPRVLVPDSVGQGRRDDPATPVPLGAAIQGKRNFQQLTKHFDDFSKALKDSAIPPASRGRGRGRGGLGRSGSRAPSLLGLGGTILKGLRFCIPPETNQVNKHKQRWDIISKLGGDVVLQPDTAITHIVYDSGRSAAVLARELGLESLTELPEGTVCVKWEWVAQCKLAGKVLDTTAWLSFPRTAFTRTVSVSAAQTRMADITQKLRGSSGVVTRKRAARSDSESESSERPVAKFAFRPVLPTRSAGSLGAPLVPATRSTVATRHSVTPGPGWVEPQAGQEDGLDVMIVGLKNGSIQDDDDGGGNSGDEQSDEEPGNPNPWADKFKCGQKHDGTAPTGPNEWLAKQFDDLHSKYEAMPGKNEFAIRGYQKTAGILRRTAYAITSGAQAKKIKGIGSSMADRIDEFLTGAQGRAYYEDNERARTMAIFHNVYGVGKKHAHDLWQQGARSLDDLRTKDFGLTEGQKLGVELYDDLNSRIPRDECRQIFEAIREAALAIDPKIWIEIMGSYRRGAENSGDVDILITRDPSDGITHVGVLKRLLSSLHASGILTHDLTTPSDYTALESKWMGVGRISPTGKYRRIDILTIPYDQWGAALIYFTGNEVGYSLNQRGLSHGVIRDRKGEKMTEGHIIASRTEREIFDVLGIRWRPPHERRP
ncbi:hypothetical protein Q8F55_007604 [Vanrija albida]|uniref:DNA polymerase lambda n=1 Tax=Vanrija albida TaxID=181172 RepID=A0ABR3PU00_9TREE